MQLSSILTTPVTGTRESGEDTGSGHRPGQRCQVHNDLTPMTDCLHHSSSQVHLPQAPEEKATAPWPWSPSLSHERQGPSPGQPSASAATLQSLPAHPCIHVVFTLNLCDLFPSQQFSGAHLHYERHLGNRCCSPTISPPAMCQDRNLCHLRERPGTVQPPTTVPCLPSSFTSTQLPSSPSLTGISAFSGRETSTPRGWAPPPSCTARLPSAHYHLAPSRTVPPATSKLPPPARILTSEDPLP